MRRSLLWTLLSLTLLPLAAPGAAQDPPAPPQAAQAAQLAKIQVTLEKIAATLARQSEGQDLDLLMKRVQLGVSQISEVERRLKDAETRREQIQDRKVQHEMQIRMFEARSERAESDGMSPEDREAFVLNMQDQLKRTTQRITTANAEINELQSRVTEAQSDLESWKTDLDRRLGGR